MLASADAFESFYENFRQLFAEGYPVEEIEQETENVLHKALNYLADISKAITSLEDATNVYEAEGTLWSRYYVWHFISLRDPDEPWLRQSISKLHKAKQLDTLLDQVVKERLDILARQQAIETRILAAWHQKFPRFSSMGIIDSAIQSKNLKDIKKLARR